MKPAAGPLHPEALGACRVGIWGFGREGRALWQTLRRLHPDLPLTVFAPGQAIAGIDDARLSVLAREPTDADLAQLDVLLKSPGVSAYDRRLARAAARGLRIASGVELWFAAHPDARVIAISGTKGKSTTAAATAAMLRAGGLRVALAGNIGLPLIELYRPEPAPDWWVLELSSYQTRELPRAADIGLLLNLYPEHLDWHGGFDQYQRDKLRLLTAPGPGRRLVNAAEPQLWSRLADLPGIEPWNRAPGWQADAAGLWRDGRLRVPAEAIALPGAHNWVNLCAALSLVEAAGADIDAACALIPALRGLPHRLQALGEDEHGLHWVNDSISTVPEATLAALAALDPRPVLLILGGYDRGIDWTAFATRAPAGRLRAVLVQGQNRERICAALAQRSELKVLRSADLAEAVALARELGRPGDAVLLSPGAPSFPCYRDYAERGAHFAALAGFPGAGQASITGLGLN